MNIKEKIEFFKINLKDKYDVLPTAKKEDLHNFEKHYQLKLPEYYKFFVTNVANGIICNKKYNGYCENIISDYDFKDLDQIDDTFENPFIKFPLTNPTYELHETQYDYFDVTNGTIFLKGTGCGNGIRLIIKGKSFGQVWIDEVMSNDEIFPAFLNSNIENNFENWINNSLDYDINQKLREAKERKERIANYTKIAVCLIAIIVVITLIIVR
ncbi:SMI1/KNR4 family protein [Olleya sp. YS]|uniref:SMI1/KNR4 family protein n=1 Tax=Olleya sp. YS TaxID=3028318 RepID=UPI00243429D0|nr:SMI1/KNR4 family protein [Olleya sp. YS]WGD35257.1 SMI1/KNR4 family protein [Olleya sp. YS]